MGARQGNWCFWLRNLFSPNKHSIELELYHAFSLVIKLCQLGCILWHHSFGMKTSKLSYVWINSVNIISGSFSFENNFSLIFLNGLIVTVNVIKYIIKRNEEIVWNCGISSACGREQGGQTGNYRLPVLFRFNWLLPIREVIMRMPGCSPSSHARLFVSPPLHISSHTLFSKLLLSLSTYLPLHLSPWLSLARDQPSLQMLDWKSTKEFSFQVKYSLQFVPWRNIQSFPPFYQKPALQVETRLGIRNHFR